MNNGNLCNEELFELIVRMIIRLNAKIKWLKRNLSPLEFKCMFEMLNTTIPKDIKNIRDVFQMYGVSDKENDKTHDDTDYDADDFTDIKDKQQDVLSHDATDEVTESLENDNNEWKYRSPGNHIASRRTISDENYKLIDDAIVNTKTPKEALAVLREKGIDVSYSTVCRRKNIMSGSGKSKSRNPYITKAKIAFNEMKEMGCKEYNGDIYYADGTPVPVIVTTSFVKCTVWKSVRIPTKYIVAMYNGYEEKLDKYINIRYLNGDPRDTSIENLIFRETSTFGKVRRKNVEIESICKIFTEEKGDPLKTWQRCIDEVGDFIPAALLSYLRTKHKYSDISDKYFTVSDVKQWYKEKNYLSTIDLTPKYPLNVTC